MKVLIIDDYPSHGESLVDLVEVLGHEAQYAPSYTEAEWLLNLFVFDLALLDFDMPHMTGPMIASKLSKSYPKVRPVIMSAHAPDARRQQQIRDWTFLQKPLSRQKLQELFSEFLRERAGSGLVVRSTFTIVKLDEVEPSGLVPPPASPDQAGSDDFGPDDRDTEE